MANNHEQHKRSALVLGASGLTGSVLLEQLLMYDEYSRITVWVRRPLALEHPKLEQIVVNFDDQTELQRLAGESDAADIYCCLGSTIKKAGSKAAFRRVDFEIPLTIASNLRNRERKQWLLISSIGADASGKLFYPRTKGELEQALASLHFRQLSIFRPSLLLGNRKEFRLGEKAAIILSSLFSFLYVGMLRKYKPVQASQVATAMIWQALQRTEKDSDVKPIAVFENELIHRIIAQPL